MHMGSTYKINRNTQLNEKCSAIVRCLGLLLKCFLEGMDLLATQDGRGRSDPVVTLDRVFHCHGVDQSTDYLGLNEKKKG